MYLNFRLKRLSIIKAKLHEYKFPLQPFDPISIQNPIEQSMLILLFSYFQNLNSFLNLIDNKNNEKMQAAKAKTFRDDYDLKRSRIFAQIVLQKNKVWYQTNIVCRSNVMTESKSL